MQRPSKRHVLSLVRLNAGLTQKELAKLLGVAAISIQRIEQGTLPLSEDLAKKAESELDVSAGWLLANDPKEPAVSPRGTLWDKRLFEFTQGRRWSATEKNPGGELAARIRLVGSGESADQFTAWKGAQFSALIYALLESVKGTPRQGVLLYRLNQALRKIQEDFKPDWGTLESHQARIDKLYEAYEKILKKQAELEMEQLWQEESPPPGQQ